MLPSAFAEARSLFILNKVGSRPNIGRTVIYKLLYFIDFNHYEKYEEQLIGASYQKNHYGPTPVEFTKLVKVMEGHDLVKYEDEYFKYPRTKYIPLKEPDLSVLSARELDTINEVLERLGHMNAAQISDLDIAYRKADNGPRLNDRKYAPWPETRRYGAFSQRPRSS